MPDATTKAHPAKRTRAPYLFRRYVTIRPAIQQKGLMTANKAGAATTDAETRERAECGASLIVRISAAQYAGQSPAGDAQQQSRQRKEDALAVSANNC
jgi:hypothetical protein